MSHALIPGSFDPITVGHLDIIARAADRFDRITVAVMHNDMRKYVPDAAVKSYRFTADERREMAEAACAHLGNVTVILSDGMLVDLVDAIEADVIIKGVRSEQDFAYEQKHALWNRAHNPRAETLYMPADPGMDGISSTLVRERLAAGDPIGGLVPPPVEAYIREHTRSV